MNRLRFAACLTIVLGTCLALANAQAGEKSDSKVKAKATTTKVSADGKQIVTITFEVEKGWYIYANPINANTEVLAPNQTRVTLKAKQKIEATVKYPAGKKKKDGKYEFDVYEGPGVIQAQVVRTLGDSSPLQISIAVNACRKGECLLPGTVKIIVP